jgi:hypothetical protein
MRQSKGNHRRISSAQRPWASAQLLVLALFAAAALAGSLSLLTLHNSRGRQHLLHGDEGSPVAPSLEELYGSLNSSSSSSNGPHQILLLSYFNSGASLLARLLMLMGVFAGDGEQLKIGAWCDKSTGSCGSCSSCLECLNRSAHSTHLAALHAGVGCHCLLFCYGAAALHNSSCACGVCHTMCWG